MRKQSLSTDSTPARGEFRPLRFEDLTPRTALVMWPVPTPAGEEGASYIRLASIELEYAMAYDVRLEASETGLPAPILIETDMSIAVWNWQLDEPIGHLNPLLSGLLRLNPDLSQFESRLGIPRMGPQDSRSTWKDYEYECLRGFGSDFFRELFSDI